MTTFATAQANPHYKRDLLLAWLVAERPELATLAVACWLVQAGNEARMLLALIEGGPWVPSRAPERDWPRMRQALAELYV